MYNTTVSYAVIHEATAIQVKCHREIGQQTLLKRKVVDFTPTVLISLLEISNFSTLRLLQL